MNNRAFDTALCYKLLKMLLTPFRDTDAYKLGIIDSSGNPVRRRQGLGTEAEKNAYTHLHRLIFNIKRILNKIPGSETRIKHIATGLFLAKEHIETPEIDENKLTEQFDNIILENRLLIDEETDVIMYLEDAGSAVPSSAQSGPFGSHSPINTTIGAEVDEPKIHPKNKKKYQKMNRRSTPLEILARKMPNSLQWKS